MREFPTTATGERAMPLMRGREDILITMNGVRFLMGDGEAEN
jgi:hypothetical protein